MLVAIPKLTQEFAWVLLSRRNRVKLGVEKPLQHSIWPVLPHKLARPLFIQILQQFIRWPLHRPLKPALLPIELVISIWLTVKGRASRKASADTLEIPGIAPLAIAAILFLEVKKSITRRVPVLKLMPILGIRLLHRPVIGLSPPPAPFVPPVEAVSRPPVGILLVPEAASRAALISPPLQTFSLDSALFRVPVLTQIFMQWLAMSLLKAIKSIADAPAFIA